MIDCSNKRVQVAQKKTPKQNTIVLWGNYYLENMFSRWNWDLSLPNCFCKTAPCSPRWRVQIEGIEWGWFLYFLYRGCGMLAGAPAAPVTPGTAAAPSWPWNHRFLLASISEVLLRGESLQLKDGMRESKMFDSPKGTGWAPLSTCPQGQNSAVRRHFQTRLAPFLFCGSLTQGCSSPYSCCSPVTVYSFPCHWHRVAWDLESGSIAMQVLPSATGHWEEA